MSGLEVKELADCDGHHGSAPHLDTLGDDERQAREDLGIALCIFYFCVQS